MYDYSVMTAEFGELVKRDTSIEEARAWARLAFPKDRTITVRRLREVKRCPVCMSAPCADGCADRRREFNEDAARRYARRAGDR